MGIVSSPSHMIRQDREGAEEDGGFLVAAGKKELFGEWAMN